RRCPKCQGTHQERICPTTICFRCQGTGHLANTCNRPLRCQKCGEEGHTDRRCNSETVRRAQPSQRQAQNNVVQFMSDTSYESEEDQDVMEVYPVATGARPGRPARNITPYKKPMVSKKGKEPETIISGKPREDTSMDQDEPELGQKIQDMIREGQQTEQKEEKKTRHTRKFEYNIFNTISKTTVEIPIKDLIENSLYKQQIKRGLMDNGPKYEEVTQVNRASLKDQDDQPKKSSAYVNCYIEDEQAATIVDSGSSGNLVSHLFVKRIGWEVEAETRQTMNVADGYTAIPLGQVFDLPIRFGKVTIPADAIVVDTEAYDMILGNDWLESIMTVIDIGKRKIRITWKGRNFEM